MSGQKKARPPKPSRRTLLLGGGAGLSLLSTPAISKNIKEIRMLTSWPKNSPGPGMAAERLAKRLEILSDHRFKVRVFAAGELVPATEVFDAVAEGKAEISHTASFYWVGKIRAAVFFTTVPFGLAQHEHEAWLQTGGMEAWQKLYKPYGLLPMAAGNTGMQMAGWFTRPLNGLADLKGLKIRMAGLGADIYRALGANPVFLPVPDMLPALASGLVDGVEFLGPWIDQGFGFDKYAKYYYGPGFNKPNGTSELLINHEFYTNSSESDQALFTAAAAAENAYALAEADANNAQALAQIQKKVTVDSMPAAIQTRARALATDIIAASLGSDKLGLTILDSYRQALASAEGWTRTGLGAYIAGRG